MQSKISIIIPTYNSILTIEKCLESVLEQSYSNFDVIIVDDGSTDGTLNVLKHFNDDRIKVSHQKNKGVASARNTGLSIVDFSHTDYIAFIDADDYIGKDYLKSLLSGFDNKDIDLSIGGYNEVSELGVVTRVTFEKCTYSRNELIANIITNKGVMGFLWNKLWKAEIIYENSIQFDPQISMAEDLLFAVQYINKTKNTNVFANCDYYHVSRRSSLSTRTSISSLDDSSWKAFNDFIFVQKKIITLISKDNKLALKNANAKLALTYSNYIRALEQAEKLDKHNYKLKKELKKKCKALTTSVLDKDAQLQLKERLLFIGTTFLTPLMKKIDYYRNSDKK